MFGAKSAYYRWRGMMDDAIAEARALLAKDPNDPKGLALLEAVDVMSLSGAFLFGSTDSRVAGNGSTMVAKIRQFRAKCGELWRNCGGNVAGLRKRLSNETRKREPVGSNPHPHRVNSYDENHGSQLDIDGRPVRITVETTTRPGKAPMQRWYRTRN